MMFISLSTLFILALSSNYFSVFAHVTNEIKWVNCSQNAPDLPEYLDLTSVDLTSLPTTLHCGQIEVPMDHDKPLSPNNSITLGLAMYRPKDPKGVIFYNGGGTDANAIVAWLVALNLTDTFHDLLDFDLMFMDIRGTYSSNQLNLSTAGFDAADTIFNSLPTTQEEFDAARAVSSQFIQSWIDSTTPPGIVQYVGTYETVRDYDKIREALGYEKIHFMGSSYGTYRAAQYAVTFPKHAGHFVLDSVVPHGRGINNRTQDGIAALNRGVLRIDAYCQNNSSCPWHSNGTGIIPTILHQVLDSAAQTPLPISACILPNTPCYPNSTAQDIKLDLIGYFGEPDFPQIISGLEAASNGDGILFPGFPQTDSTAISSIPLECGDLNYQDTTFASWNSTLTAALAADTSGIRYTQAFQLQLGCLGWPFPSRPNVDKVLEIEHPLLLVAADFDALAPMEWAKFVWETAPNSALVMRHGDDHTSFSLTSQPATIMMREYLRTGVLPEAKNDSLVSVYRKGMAAPAVLDPYLVATGAAAGDQDSGVDGNLTVGAFLP